MFLKISQNSQENTCARVFFYISRPPMRTCGLNFIETTHWNGKPATLLKSHIGKGSLQLYWSHTLARGSCNFIEITHWNRKPATLLKSHIGMGSLQLYWNHTLAQGACNFIEITHWDGKPATLLKSHIRTGSLQLYWNYTLAREACNFIKKEALAQVFSCEFCVIFKNTFFAEHFQTTASLFYWKPCFFNGFF